MSFNQSEHIGRPAPGVKKYKAPAGTSLYAISGERSSGFEIFPFRKTSSASDSNTLIRISDNAGLYSSSNLILLMTSWYGIHASRSWNSTPANFRLNISAPGDGTIEPAGFTEEQSITESPDCSPANINIAELSVGQKRYNYKDGIGFAPQFQIKLRFVDPPTVYTICENNFKFSGLLLLPTNAIVSIPNATSYPGTSVTLIDQN